MMDQDLKQTQAALARAGYFFTGYDWTGTGRSAVAPARAARALDPAGEAGEARRAWKRRAAQGRRAAAPRGAIARLRERVASRLHARAPGDPRIGAGC